MLLQRKISQGRTTMKGIESALKTGCAVILLLLTLASAVGAQESTQTVADRRAEYAAQIFLDSCLTHLGDEKALATWVRSKGYGLTAPDFSRAVLQGDQGEVWTATNEIGDFLILLKPRGNCEVWARRAHAQVATQGFEKALKDLQRPGRSVERDSDKEITAQGVKYRQLAYFMTQGDGKGGWLFIAITSDSEQADVQVRLSADRTR
jgi:hypothetical protein